MVIDLNKDSQLGAPCLQSTHRLVRKGGNRGGLCWRVVPGGCEDGNRVVLCNLGSERTSLWRKSQLSDGTIRVSYSERWCWGRGQLQPRPRDMSGWRNAEAVRLNPGKILGGPLTDFDVAETLAPHPKICLHCGLEEDESSVQASESGGWPSPERTVKMSGGEV